MKKKSVFLIIIIVFLVNNSDCTKEPEYLEKYLGAWSFEYAWWKKALAGPAEGDTIFFTGDIVYGPCKKCITITQISKTYKVEPDGQILNTCEPPSYPLHYQKSCKGYFEGDSKFYYETFDQTPPNQIRTYKTSLSGRRL